MKFNVAIAGALLPALALGFPQFMGATSKEDILNQLREREAAEAAEAAAANSKRSVVSSLTNTVGSLLKTVVSDVDGILGMALDTLSSCTMC